MNRDNYNRQQPEATPPHVGECERAEQLVTYFYGEASGAEASEFEQHLAQCAACQDELTAFDAVRRAVGAWRAEALDQATAPSFQFQIIPGSIAAESADKSLEHWAHSLHPTPKRSALAALRAFFDLSPLWLRIGGATTAAAVVCVLAALAVFGAEVSWDDRGLVARTGSAVRERVVTPVVKTPAAAVVMPSEQTCTASQVESLIAERVEQKHAELLAEVRNQISVQQASSITPNRKVSSPAKDEVVRRSQTPRRSSNMRLAPLAAPRLREPLVIAADREPQLYDLLGEVD